MTAESHWQHLKHTHLGFMHRPRLDQTIYTMINDVIPKELRRARELDGIHHLGRAPPLTVFQKQAKKAWLELLKCSCSGKDYNMSIKNWTCGCRGQQLQAHHLCKHPVQAVEALHPRPADFFEKLTCHRTMPIYRFPNPNKKTADSGSILDGDDEIWMGQRSNISHGGWRQAFLQNGKRSRSLSIKLITQSPKRVHVSVNLQVPRSSYST